LGARKILREKRSTRSCTLTPSRALCQVPCSISKRGWLPDRRLARAEQQPEFLSNGSHQVIRQYANCSTDDRKMEGREFVHADEGWFLEACFPPIRMGWVDGDRARRSLGGRRGNNERDQKIVRRITLRQNEAGAPLVAGQIRERKGRMDNFTWLEHAGIIFGTEDSAAPAECRRHRKVLALPGENRKRRWLRRGWQSERHSGRPAPAPARPSECARATTRRRAVSTRRWPRH